MRKRGDTVRSTAEEIAARRARGESRTDWARVDAMPQAEVERLADAEEGPLAEDWEGTVMRRLPQPKADIHIRLDADIVDWFKAQGKGYQTRINAVLRAFVESRRRMQRREGGRR